jgi:hypothetical protein
MAESTRKRRYRSARTSDWRRSARVLAFAWPHPGAALITRTSYAIVRSIGQTSANKGWSIVQLSTGQKGYIHNDFLWGSTALRAVFNLINGQWRMTALVSGD